MRRAVRFLVVALAGCEKRGVSDDQMLRARHMPTPSASEIQTPVIDVPESASAAKPEARRAPGPVSVVPAVPRLEPGMLTHVDAFGWSSDSERFGYCATSDGRGDRTCVFFPHNGPKETIGDWNDAKDEPDPKLAAQQRARLRELGLVSKSGDWAFGDDLEIAWDVYRETVLRVGARVRGHAPSFSVMLRDRLDFGMVGGIHPDAIVVSPDGKWLGVVSHTFHGEFTDAYEVGTVRVARAASQAYNDAGYTLHRAANWRRAAELFRKAVDADPTFARPKYNLACAYARLGDPRTEGTLRAALASAGEDSAETKRKARSDPDFAGVADEAWFDDALK